MSRFGNNPLIFSWPSQGELGLKSCYLPDRPIKDDSIIEIRYLNPVTPKSLVSESVTKNEPPTPLLKSPPPTQTPTTWEVPTLPLQFKFEPQQPTFQTTWEWPVPPREASAPSEPKPESTISPRGEKKRVRHTTFDDFSDDEISDADYETDDEMEICIETSHDDETQEHKLGASKSPVMEALVYCALQGWGLHLVKCQGSEITFKVDDFELYCKKSSQICSKQHPTNDKQARIKALKRWFPDFPNRRDVPQPPEFYITIAKDKDKLTKIRRIIEKNRRLVGVKKVRRLA